MCSERPDRRARSLCFLARSLNTGGAERQLVQTAIGLQNRGWLVSVVLFYGGGELERELTVASVPIVHLGKRGRWDVFGFLMRARLTLRTLAPDVIYCFLGTANIVGALTRPSGKWLVWSVRSSNMDLRVYGWTSRAGYVFERTLARLADVIISNSVAGAALATSSGFPSAKMYVVPNGVDTARFKPDSVTRSIVRAEWGVSASDLVVGTLARLDPMKDHHTFIEAAALIAQKMSGVKFVCVGEGPIEYREQLVALAQRRGLGRKIIWLGKVDQPERVLNGFDIYCSSSAFGEGFSNSISEAMACGLPVVATDVGDSAAILGVYGVTVRPRDPAALSAAIVSTLERLHDPSAVRSRIQEEYSIDAMLDRTEPLLDPTARG